MGTLTKEKNDRMKVRPEKVLGTIEEILIQNKTGVQTQRGTESGHLFHDSGVCLLRRFLSPSPHRSPPLSTLLLAQTDFACTSRTTSRRVLAPLSLVKTLSISALLAKVNA